MSVEAMAWALGVPKDNPTDACVLLGLANHADEKGKDAFPSVELLADYCGCSPRTVQRTLARLEEAGLIRDGDPTLRDAVIGRADRRPRVWDLAMERGDSLSPRSERGDTGDANFGNFSI
jgi:DNA-binding transcriptional ArsR family regulator